jgi:glycerol-3-phosphate acyltransferase PlsY
MSSLISNLNENEQSSKILLAYLLGSIHYSITIHTFLDKNCHKLGKKASGGSRRGGAKF